MLKAIYANGSFTSNQFNSLGQRVGQVDQAGLATQFAYDVSGQLTNVTKPQVPDPENGNQLTSPAWSYAYDDYGRLTVSTDPKGRTNTFGYDELGRPLTRRLPMGETETNVYNAKGQLWKRYDFKGQKTELVYDKFGRTSAKFFFHAGAAYPSNAVCYQFNTLGQLWKIVERSGADATTNACDGYASMVGVPNVGQRFQPASWLEVIVAALTRVPAPMTGGMLAVVLLAVAYFAIPRTVRRELTASLLEACRAQLFSLSAPGGEGRGEVAVGFRKRFLPAFGWRFASLFTIIALLATDPHFDSLFTAQAACTIPSNSSTETTRLTEFAYDDEVRLAQVNAPEGVINYGYDLATGRHTSTCTTNSEVAYGYDELGRLKTVSVLKRNGAAVSPPEVTTYTYTAVGSRETVTLPNGIVTTWRYDNLNRLTNLTHQAGTTNLATYSYQLHSTGRRTNATEILRQETGTYLTNTLSWNYDAMYRLTNEVSSSSASDGQYSSEYQYDKAGNRANCTRQPRHAWCHENKRWDRWPSQAPPMVSRVWTFASRIADSPTNPSQSEGKLAYSNSTSQRHARLGALSWFAKSVFWRACFISARPVRIRSSLRPFQLGRHSYPTNRHCAASGPLATDSAGRIGISAGSGRAAQGTLAWVQARSLSGSIPQRLPTASRSGFKPQ
jgi:YD repeat-containing protein